MNFDLLREHLQQTQGGADCVVMVQADALTKAALPAFVAAVRAEMARGVPARALHAFDAADLAASGAGP